MAWKVARTTKGDAATLAEMALQSHPPKDPAQSSSKVHINLKCATSAYYSLKDTATDCQFLHNEDYK